MSPIVNAAGSAFDFGRITSAVLQECEHRRRAIPTNDAKRQLTEIAHAKLAEIKTSFDDAHGASSYWKRLENEIVVTVLPQYLPAAIAESRREKYDQKLWGGGTMLLRVFLVIVSLGMVWLLSLLPFVAPAAAITLALAFGAVALFYPEISRKRHRSKHARLLARLVEGSDAYQQNAQVHYLSDADLEELFEPIEPAESEAERRARSAAAAEQSQRS